MSRSRKHIAAASVAVLGTVAPVSLAAQAVTIGAARWFGTPHESDYRLSVGRRWIGPVAVSPFAQVIVRTPERSATLAGVGGELIVRPVADARPYLVGSLSGGFLDFERSLAVRAWSSWSAGIGAEVRVLSVGVAIETRYQRLSLDRTDGVSLGLRVGSPIGRSSGAGSDRLPTNGRRSDSSEAARSTRAPAVATIGAARNAEVVVDLARQAMGTPYRWGGSDQNGFDCSGLIRYAYAQIGIDLPRRSRDQASSGREVARSVAGLAPGDILGFADRPGSDQVSHVGLYVGEGRFIHSASKGVRISELGEADGDGRWWVARWIAARRVLE